MHAYQPVDPMQMNDIGTFIKWVLSIINTEDTGIVYESLTFRVKSNGKISQARREGKLDLIG